MQKILFTPLAMAMLGSMLAAQEPASADLSYKAVKKWEFNVPNEQWSDAASGLGIKHKNGDKFTAYRDGLALELSVDTDGDGKTDSEVKGAKGFLVLKADDVDGDKLHYAVRFKIDGKQYKYATSGVMRGSLAGESITLIDQNNNGVWNEVGVDAMICGKGNAASYLSKIANLNGSLYEIEVSANGKHIDAKPYAGESGELSLRNGFKARGKIEAAVVNSTDGQYSFELAGSASLRVPVGSYKLAAGLASKSSEGVRIGAGKMKPLEVRAGAETSLEWGAPVVAEFTFGREGEAVKIEPSSLHYYGRAGEEYVEFLPQGASPKFLVYDERTEKLLKTGRFGT
jgi:hypothetical protein